MKISIVIPAYNEEKRISATLNKYFRFFKEKKKSKELDFEVLIVLNGCKDNTIGVIKEYAKKYKEIKYLDLPIAGKGLAIVAGFKEALTRNNDLIGFVDADSSTSVESYYNLIKNIGRYDGIIASRWIKGAEIEYTLFRKIESWGFNFIVRSLFLIPYRDTQCGAKIFKKKVIEKVKDKIEITEWAFDVNLLYEAKKGQFKIKEHPTIWIDAEGSHLKAINTTIQMFLALIRLRLIHSPFRKIVRIYDKLHKRLKI